MCFVLNGFQFSEILFTSDTFCKYFNFLSTFADGLEKSEMIQPIRLEKLIARRPEELSKPIIKLQKYCDGPQSNAMGHHISAQIGNNGKNVMAACIFAAD